MMIIEILKALFLGIIEGITEWLPISSTGHMILADEFLRLNMSEAFKEMFLVVIQLGAILAVVVLYWRRLVPLALGKKAALRKDTLTLWLKIIVACIPAAATGLLLDDKINGMFFNYQTVAAALIFYGVLFIVVERHRGGFVRVIETEQLDYKTAFLIGLFQVLSLIPGTSRSGATILGAILLGTSRTVAAEFSFFLSVPVMLGASLLKLVKFGFAFTGVEIAVLLTGAAAAFVVSMLAIRFLTGYVRNHDFKVFGLYRIVLGVVVLIYFLKIR